MRNPDRATIRTFDCSEAFPGWALATVAIVQARPGERYERDPHRHHTIECVLAGRGLVRVGSEERHCQAGDSYHLPQGVGHLIVADGEEPWRKIYCEVHGDFLTALKEAYGLEQHCFAACNIAALMRRFLEHRGTASQI